MEAAFLISLVSAESELLDGQISILRGVDCMVEHAPFEVENPMQVLRDEDGEFEAISPHGHVFRVKCRKGSRMRVREVGTTVALTNRLWRIKRLGNSAPSLGLLR